MAMSNMVSAGGSSFGPEQSTWGSNSRFSGRHILESERFHDLDRKQSYYDCTQHDFKRYDFDGRIISSGGGISATQPLMSGEKAAFYVPLRSRRPSNPYRLPRAIVNSFTNMVFGEGRFPVIRVEGDADSQDYAQTLARVANLPVRFISARNMGGSTGTSVISWCFVNGRPAATIHNPKNLYVHEWEDRAALIPRHVTEAYVFPKDEYDAQKKKLVRYWYWYRRDWTPDADIVFAPVQHIAGHDPVWVEPDTRQSVTHNDGRIHLEWIQNLPSEDIDGMSDYEGQYEGFDGIDLLLSVIMRGATLNLDPTLVLNLDPDLVQRMGIRKGSDNALIVGEGGGAQYLELGGQSIEAGLKLFESNRKSILEVAECVLPDPNEIAAQGTSSVAQKMVFSPMLGKCDVLRDQYGCALARMLEAWLIIARGARSNTVIVYDDDGSEHLVTREIKLPPRVDKEPELDESGVPTGEEVTTATERNPGQGEEVDPQWGPYFRPTPQDQQLVVGSLAVATANQPFISTQSATEIAMAYYGREPAGEWARVQQAHAATEEKHAQMFGDESGATGGKVALTQKLPTGITVKRSKDNDAAPPPEKDSSSGSSGKVSMQPADLAALITVNEARAAHNLGPVSGPDGELTVAAWKSKYAEHIATAANADAGKLGTTDATPPKPTLPPGMGGAPPGAAKPPLGGPPKPGAPPPGAPKKPFGGKGEEEGE